MGNNNIMTLEKRRQIARLKFLFSLFSHQFNINPEFYIQPRLSRRTRCTHKHTLTITFARTNRFKYSFFPRSIDEWKVLPAKVFFCAGCFPFLKTFYFTALAFTPCFCHMVYAFSAKTCSLVLFFFLRFDYPFVNTYYLHHPML